MEKNIWYIVPASVYLEEAGIFMPSKIRRILRLSDSKELFLLDCKARRLARSTLSFYTHRLQTFIDWCVTQDITLLADVDSTLIKRFLVYCQEQEFGEQYQHGLARSIRSFLNYCVRDGLIKQAPKFPMPRLPKKVIPALTPDDVRKILRACTTARDKAIVLTLYDTGIRASELIALTIADLDFGVGAITVRHGKGNKWRIVPIGSRARKQIRKYLLERPDAKPTEALFQSNRKRHLGLDGLIQVMGRLKAVTGIEHCTCHSFRRTFAITCLRNGMNVHILARIMGHADIATLRHYLDIAESDLHNAHSKAGPGDRMM